ncbi:unnamed protein product [Urochloa decumbens]|uniref:C2H2-type domain-containing protein n=1 Tax=Urochloa decumbens TaxID=240449 RepID=A0ABC9AVT9_9POAL
MEDFALQQLIGVDWSARCSSLRFCMECARAICSHCCGDHWRRHHADKKQADIVFVEGRPALDTESAPGCRYDLTRIQRIVWEGQKFILLCPVGQDDLRCHRRCETCQHTIKSGSLWCSVCCKAQVEQGGRLRGAVLQLAAMAQDGEFGPAVHRKDLFCTVCGIGFCSTSCVAHAHHHHPAVAPGSVKAVVHFNGWAAVPAGVLPAAVVHDVQALQLPDGSVAYPIHSRGAGHQTPAPGAMHVMGVGGPQPHPCLRPDCPEVFFGPEAYCSMRCRHQAG